MIYLIGSMQNPRIPEVAVELRDEGFEVFDDWYSPGPETDVFWYEHEQIRGRNFVEALAGAHAQDVFAFDKRNLDEADAAILVLPAGKSAHLELGYIIGAGKPGYILLEGEPERFDLMYAFATGLFYTLEDLMEVL